MSELISYQPTASAQPCPSLAIRGEWQYFPPYSEYIPPDRGHNVDTLAV